jgi:hypothetical protein
MHWAFLAQVTLLTPFALVTKVVISGDEDVDESLDPPLHANMPAEVKNINPISAARFLVSFLII